MQCDDLVGELDPTKNRAESCNAVAGDAVTCYGVEWITKLLGDEVQATDWIIIPRPGTAV